MPARLVRPDATTDVVDLPASPGEARAVICGLLACAAVTCIPVIPRGPGGPGVNIWIDDDHIRYGAVPANPAAAAVIAFLTRRRPRGAPAGTVVFTGAGPHGTVTSLTSSHDELITTIASALHAGMTAGSGQPPADGSPA